MLRYANDNIQIWNAQKSPKPLIFRGARQTGKTHFIDDFTSKNFQRCLSINLEKEPSFVQFTQNFLLKEGMNAKKYLHEISFAKGMESPEILFIDEIQQCPELLQLLRYFKEDLPGFKIIAAGSLVDFVLSDKSISMPVGRVDFFHFYPMTFFEFLEALGEKRFVATIKQIVSDQELPSELVHQKIMSHFRTYLFVGGMPEAVKTYAQTQSLADVVKVLTGLRLSFEADFLKYTKLGAKFKIDALSSVFEHCPGFVAKKMVYSKLDPHFRAADLKAALYCLEQARIIQMIYNSKSDLPPLATAKDSSNFKLEFLDVGLFNQFLKLPPINLDEIFYLHKGALAEQFVGQEIAANTPYFEPSKLYYWSREQKNANAEVDFVIECGSSLLPIEVKSGGSSKLKSLEVYLAEKHLKSGVLLNTELPTELVQKREASVFTQGKSKKIQYDLIHLPIYCAAELSNIIKDHSIPRPFSDEEF